ncbi:CAMK/CAMK1 protein kinase, variant 1 [Aphanomyces astaci]|uniref:CAMK/CAMK1 protein kinase, variant 1 n=1 Tax=Aphanomyces astaci TaxID=112090 RepID=W4GS43_APHAT|nr:CAMK/CAMK1 protein kinase, variant 1 [Aphanomyces astaci]ETV81708.1 CAMK/CAMK1 protein kinase, variant 1 [Aphanomyces astaci]|eukprot:XP_009828445.1 CAMK/CAMK1 protein kinase, variant 1 [Aphanomyces astaci]
MRRGLLKTNTRSSPSSATAARPFVTCARRRRPRSILHARSSTSARSRARATTCSINSSYFLQVEIQVLQSLDHPNIIHMEDVYQTDTRICMVTELMEGGELFDYVVQKGTLSEVEASCLVRKITSAIAYMHACGVVHRDLKPENVLLTSPSPNAEIKIIDFGLAKLLHDSQTRSFLGTRGYLAPEMLRRQSYSKSIDVWALGVIVYVLLCGCLPFNDDGSKITSDKAARAKFGLRFPRWASGLSDSAKDLLRHLLEVDSEKRYTAEQACLHPWVTGQRTPNQFLESPNYLKSIKQRHQAVVADAVAAANQSPATDTTLLPGLHSRRLSH